MSENDEKIVWAISIDGEGTPLILIGIPKPCWKNVLSRMHTSHADLSKVGLPIKFMLFGADTHEECLKVVKEHNERQGLKTKYVGEQGIDIKGEK